MPEKLISVDEFMSKRAPSAKGTIVKAAKAPATWDGEKRSAVFTMSTQQEDRDGDIVFTAGIDTSEFEKNPVALLFHKSREFPVGTWSDIRKQPQRLEGTCTFIPEGIEEDADSAAKLVAAGVLRACSIGFIPKTVALRTMDNGEPTWSYEIRECELVECSIVPIPANPGALVKSADGDSRLAKELLEQVLDEWAKTPEGLLVPRAEYEKTYKVVIEKIAPPPAPPASAFEKGWNAVRKALGLDENFDPLPPAQDTKEPALTDDEIVSQTMALRARQARLKASLEA